MSFSRSWNLAFIVSVCVHLLLAAAVLLMPSEKEEKPKSFVTQLVSPEELGKQPVPSPPTPPAPARPPQQPRPKSPAPRVRIPVPQTARPSRPPVPVPEQEGGSRPQLPRAGGAPAVEPGAEGRIPVAPSPGSEGVRPGDIKRQVPMKEKLFDREIVERLARKEEPKKDKGITFDTDEYKYRTYMLRLKDKIENIWRYPAEATMKGLYGDLYIRFTIKRNGMLGDIDVVRTSGHRILDEAAMRALRDAQPYWPLPDEWGKEALTITGHFVYSIYGTAIR